MVSNADCNLVSICGEMALRFSGRLSVRVASSPGNSNFSVSNMQNSFWTFCCVSRLSRLSLKLTAKLLHHGRVRVFRAHFVGHFQQRREGYWIDSRVASGLADGGQNIFGGDIADESIAGERAAAESCERGIKTTAACFIGRENFLFGVFRPAVQVDAQLDACDVIFNTAV